MGAPPCNQVHSRGDGLGETNTRLTTRRLHRGGIGAVLREPVTGLCDRCPYTCIKQNFTLISRRYNLSFLLSLPTSAPTQRRAVLMQTHPFPPGGGALSREPSLTGPEGFPRTGYDNQKHSARVRNPAGRQGLRGNTREQGGLFRPRGLCGAQQRGGDGLGATDNSVSLSPQPLPAGLSNFSCKIRS